MEGVDHIHVVEVGGGRLIGQVHRMLQGQVPNGEGLELGIARIDAPLVLMIQLGQAGGHFSAAGAGGGDHHQGAAGLDVIVLAQTLVADDVPNVGGVACNGIVLVDSECPGTRGGVRNASAAGWPL